VEFEIENIGGGAEDAPIEIEWNDVDTESNVGDS